MEDSRFRSWLASTPHDSDESQAWNPEQHALYWRLVRSRKSESEKGCRGRSCNCGYAKARKAADAADVVIMNHALLSCYLIHGIDLPRASPVVVDGTPQPASAIEEIYIDEADPYWPTSCPCPPDFENGRGRFTPNLLWAVVIAFVVYAWASNPVANEEYVDDRVGEARDACEARM